MPMMPGYDIDKLLRPRSVAVVGASVRETSRGTRVIRNLQKAGFPGRIFPVNPRHRDILGLPCFPSLEALSEPVDAVFFSVPAEKTPALLDEAGRCGVGGAFVIAAGFADGGVEGKRLEDKLVAAAKAHNIALCGPNNMGLINLRERVWCWTAFTSSKRKAGPVAVISQSGSVAVALSQDEYDLGLAYVITTGNEAVCTAADYLDAIIRDEKVRVVLLFLETIRDPGRFAAAAREAARLGKFIVVLKSGRTGAGRSAIAAHTGAVAGDDRAYDAYCRQHGIIRVADFDEMVELSVLLAAHGAPPATRSVLPMTVSGGEASLMADLAETVGLPVVGLSTETRDRLKPFYPPFRSLGSPLDLAGLAWDPARIKRIVEALLQDAEIGAICCGVDAPASGEADGSLAIDIAAVLAELAPLTEKRFVLLNNTAVGGRNGEVLRILEPAGIPYLSGMRSAFAAIARWIGYRGPQPGADTAPDGSAADWRRRLADADSLSDPKRYRLLSDAGIPMVECEAVASPDQAVAAAERLGYPVVLKGTGPDLTHKSDLRLVRLGLGDESAVRHAFGDLKAGIEARSKRPHLAQVVIQPMVAAGVELLVGVRNDPAFGTIVVAGLGGTLVELADEVSVRLGPVSRETALAMLLETRAGRMLSGLRGRPAADIDAAADAIAALSRLGTAARGLAAAIEVNPLIVHEQSHGAVGVDLVIEPSAHGSGRGSGEPAEMDTRGRTAAVTERRQIGRAQGTG